MRRRFRRDHPARVGCSRAALVIADDDPVSWARWYRRCLGRAIPGGHDGRGTPWRRALAKFGQHPT
ncbi:hypothetical protein KPL78_03410 [Roseomonas sp. HJA6]|uniref:Response regulator n=1 Tax=Roseomonas alba TaxID=2846776 RepID=A0ABS7A3I6_9PROT|nr:hypothetical protein [Neoroseomonas alba]